MDCFLDNGSFDDNVESFLSSDDADPGEGIYISFCCNFHVIQVKGIMFLGVILGFMFSEIGSIHTSAVDCCDFSSDGKLLVTGGNDKKVRLFID